MQLIRITTQPYRCESSSTQARLEVDPELPRHEMGKQGGTMEIQQRHVQVRLDTQARRSSMGLRSNEDFAAYHAQRGYQAVMQKTAEYADLGNQMVHIERGANIPDAMFAQHMQRVSAQLDLVPTAPIDISWQPGGTDIRYTPVELSFNWNVGQVKLNFTPSSLSVNVLQYPSINFEYLGQPNYVPPSAAPHFSANA